MIREEIRVLCLLFVALCGGCSFGSLGRVTVNGQDAPAYLSQVQVVRDNAALKTEAGMALEKGDLIETGPDATVALRLAGADAVLFPKTKIAILNPSIFAWFGQVWVNGLFTTKTKYVTAASEGTEYVVQVEPDGATTTLTVIEGRVQCASPQGQWRSFIAERAERVRVTADESSVPSIARSRLSADEYNGLLRQLSAAGLTERLVPDVTGLVLERAQQELTRSSITIIETQLAPVEATRLGLVLSQSPAPGGRSSQIRLIVGTRAVQAPNLLGHTLDEARSLLTAVHLSVGEVSQKYSGDYPPGSITEQSPASGASTAEGGSVAITIEQEPAVVPNLSGRTSEQAKLVLSEHGLRLGQVTERIELDSGVGIAEQSPRAEQKVGPGTAVDVVVLVPGARVPNLVGLAGAGIDAGLTRAGLSRGETRKREVISDGAVASRIVVRDGSVLEQTPKPESVVARGSRVDLVVAAVSVKMCSVPDALGGANPAEIRARFRTAGLNATVEIASNGGGAFLVISQSVGVGQQVPCGTQVTIQAFYRGPN